MIPRGTPDRSSSMQELRATSTVSNPLLSNHKVTKKSTFIQLEEMLARKISDKTIQQMMNQHEELNDAIGKISFAVSLERKVVGTPLSVIEDSYSKSLVSITLAMSKDEIAKNDLIIHSLQSFQLLINNHLHQIVKLQDSNKNKPVSHYDQLEEENVQRKDQVEQLKRRIIDLELEVETYKKALEDRQNSSYFGENGKEVTNKEERMRKMEIPKWITEMDIENSKRAEEKAQLFWEEKMEKK
eukprot:TRINITY_DN2969_c0_g1_i5.p2 TRINITY_DN2969_c0_g1~~TRINITY_DN2969_c0_g1_i5.p2  ORF type:complete len:242 (+),score=89.43 TRINITY_DN2969_c0_g1_i5:245-970(+)